MMVPSFVGFTPRSLSRMAFSMPVMELRSYGVMIIVRASGVWKEASCCSGVGDP
jgi:hypothetical protein